VSAPGTAADAEAAARAIEVLRAGGFVLLAESRAEDANASLTVAADIATAPTVNFMSQHAYGLIRLALSDERCEVLRLHSTLTGTDEWRPTISISAREAGPTGASAADRALTIRTAADPASGPDAIVQPGHVFPLRARPGGVLRRAGRTEAAIDLARLAGYSPAAAISLVLDEEGNVAVGDKLRAYAEQHGFPIVTIGDVVAYRRARDRLVERVTTARIPTPHGDFRGVAYKEEYSGAYHVALVHGDVTGADDVLVRVHRRCFGGDIFRDHRCTCRLDLERALELLAAEERGVLVYLLGGERLDARLNRHEDPTPKPDEYGIGAQILADLGLTTIRVLSRHPRPIGGLEGFDLRITGFVPLG
jgi:3,4-dihydroxy 2-butanone 4-phosphate synthase/GTP cyclohydrolase II